MAFKGIINLKSTVVVEARTRVELKAYHDC